MKSSPHLRKMALERRQLERCLLSKRKVFVVLGMLIGVGHRFMF